jgi:hypothetical protein
MPYYKHSLFRDPDCSEVKLWRYMDITKYLSILSTKSLFFTRVKKLQEYDKYEGCLPQKELDNIVNFRKEFGKKRNHPEMTESDLNDLKNSWNYSFENIRNRTFVNCWHYNKNESIALWKIYAGNRNGICLQSQIDGFKNSFRGYHKNIFIGKVEYLNYDNNIYADKFDTNYNYNLFYMFLTKENAFQYEKEYRALFMVEDENELNKFSNQNGIYVPIDLNTLIEEIIISPGSPDWFLDLVKEVTEKYGLKKEIIKSSLDKELPDFKI